MRRAARDAFVKLDPRKLAGNPVILATEVVAVLATVSTVVAWRPAAASLSPLQIALWLWATVLFANFAESVAEGRGKAAADSPARRAGHHQGQADRRRAARRSIPPPPTSCAWATSSWSRRGDMIPADGEIIEGVASVNEAPSPASARR